MSKQQKGLGRGLSALMADVNEDLSAPAQQAAPAKTGQPAAPRDAQFVPIEKIFPNPDQPRRTFEQSALEELSASIKEKGVIQPLVVRPRPNHEGDYEIVAGERRWRASQLAKLHELPIVIRDYNDTEVLEVAIIENIQRADLNAIEEAAGYKQLMETFGHTQEKLSEALGKSRSHIANLMRLLQLPMDVQKFVIDGSLSAGHARALITAASPSELARKVMADGLSVRETEKLAKAGDTVSVKTETPRAPQKDADTKALESDVGAALGLKVQIDHNDVTQKGKLTINYKDLEVLDQLCQLLSKGLK